LRLPEFATKPVGIRTCKYLNLVEQDHRHVKRRVGAMLGCKKFENAATVLAGVELVHKIRKQQFDLRRVGGSDIPAPELWTRVLAA
jgi:transposase-like protein